MNDNKRTAPICLAVLFILCVFGSFPGTSISADEATGEQRVKRDARERENPYVKAEITIKIIPSVNQSFGYDILLYGRPLVHQPNIPGLPGNEGFTTREKAQRVAEFVVRKIRNNEMPPTVTIEDLNRLDALK